MFGPSPTRRTAEPSGHPGLEQRLPVNPIDRSCPKGASSNDSRYIARFRVGHPDTGPGRILVIQPLLATAVATRVSTITRTSSHNTRFPVVVADPVTDWTAEGEEIDVSEPDLTEVVVTPSKLAGLTVVSNELVADSDPSVLDIVGDGLVRDLQVRLDAAYFGNTTANGPSGLLSLADVQVISWGSITDLDPFAGSRAITNAPCCCVTLPPWLNLTSPELAELSILVRERNAIEVRIARMLDRPISVGDTQERGAVLIPARRVGERCSHVGLECVGIAMRGRRTPCSRSRSRRPS